METGFPSPAQGYEEKTIDLNALLIRHPAATVFMKIDTDRYNRMGIYDGDLLIIDRALKVKPGDYVVYESEGVFRFGPMDYIEEQQRRSPDVQYFICGVVTNVIHTVKNKFTSITKGNR